MHLINDYEIYIFDCDGVILDSNQLKIEAMEMSLKKYIYAEQNISECIEYFRNNFGKSRFHHVDIFLNQILDIKNSEIDELKKSILNEFSIYCKKLYLTADLTPGIIDFIKKCKGKRYVASGSEQKELKEVFYKRKLNILFDGIYGSPTNKSEIINNVLKREKNHNAVMIGDAESDMLSAIKNQIDFIFYAPYSNVQELMIKQCNLRKHKIIYNFEDEIKND